MITQIQYRQILHYLTTPLNNLNLEFLQEFRDNISNDLNIIASEKLVILEILEYVQTIKEHYTQDYYNQWQKNNSNMIENNIDTLHVMRHLFVDDHIFDSIETYLDNNNIFARQERNIDRLIECKEIHQIVELSNQLLQENQTQKMLQFTANILYTLLNTNWLEYYDNNQIDKYLHYSMKNMTKSFPEYYMFALYLNEGHKFMIEKTLAYVKKFNLIIKKDDININVISFMSEYLTNKDFLPNMPSSNELINLYNKTTMIDDMHLVNLFFVYIDLYMIKANMTQIDQFNNIMKHMDLKEKEYIQNSQTILIKITPNYTAEHWYPNPNIALDVLYISHNITYDNHHDDQS